PPLPPPRFPYTTLFRSTASGTRPYSTPRPNLFDFGNPFGGRRPASARLPCQSDNSFMVALNSRPAESFQLSPVLASNTATSDRRSEEHRSELQSPDHLV